MTIKVYGPTQAPGVQVRELPISEGAEGAPVGTTFLLGTASGGPIGVPYLARTPGDLDRLFRGMGSASQVAFSTLPIHGGLFFEGGRKSNGRPSGSLWLLRLAANAAKAHLAVYDRRAPRSLLQKNPPAIFQEPAWKLEAPYEGAAYGKRYQRVISVANVGAAFGSPDTFASGITGETSGRFRGATLTFPDVDPTWSAEVRAYDPTTGELQVSPEASATIRASSAATAGVLAFENVNGFFGQAEELAAEFTDSDTATSFGLGLTLEPGGHARTWGGLKIGETSGGWEARLANDADREWITTPDRLLGDQVPSDPLTRPANLAEIPTSISGRRVYFQVVGWTRTPTKANGAYLDTRHDLTHGAAAVPCRIVCTFTSATAFTVEIRDLSGAVLTPAASLPAGSLGTSWDPSQITPKIPAFTLRAGIVAMVAGNKVEIVVRPFPLDVARRRGRLYAAAAASEGTTTTSWPIVASGADWIEVADPNVGDELTPPLPPTATGSLAGPFVLAGSDTFKFTPGGLAELTLTSTLPAGSTSTAALVAELNARELARAGSAAAKLIEFSYALANGVITWTALQDFGGYASITVGAGTLNALCGFTAGAQAGTDGKIARVQYAEGFEGGHDGDLVGEDQALAALVAGGPLRALEEANTGLITYAAPEFGTAGIGVALAQAALRTGGVAAVDLPATSPGPADDEGEAIAWFDTYLTTGPEDDHRFAYFPPRATFALSGNGRSYAVSISVTGYALGVLAKIAEEESYAQAPAGFFRARLAAVKDLPTGTAAIDLELLTAHGGMVPIKRIGPTFWLEGDRIRTEGIGPDGTRRGWLHKRRSIGHLVRVAQVALVPLTWSKINDQTLARARRLTRLVFQPFYRAGWFSDEGGPAFEDQVQIVADRSNNDAASGTAGNLAISVSFAIADTAERVVLTMDPNGVTVSE